MKGESLLERLQRKIAYLEGLAEGLDLSADQKEGRILLELIQLCKNMANRMEDLQMRLDEQEDYIEALDEDLIDLENYIFGNEEDDSEDLYMEVDPSVEEAYDDDETGYYEIECPNCGEMVLVNEEDYEDEGVVELVCPECEDIIVLEDIEGEENQDQPKEQYLHTT